VDAGVAIYWDFENVHACVLDELRGEGAYRAARFKPQEPVVDIDPVVEYAATVGRIVVHRAYGNWQYFGRYRDEVQAHAVELVQLFPLTASKNGADIRLVLDVAEDMQHQAHVTHVIVVASDSDYTSLAQRCRKQGRVFIGIGTAVTPKSFQFACDEFRDYQGLTVASIAPIAGEIAATAQEPGSLEDAAELVVTAVRRLAAGRGEPWALKAGIRPLVKRLDPTFDERRYGVGSFTELLKALDAYVVEQVGEYDHELAVRADLGEGSPPAGAARAPDSLPGSSPVELVERQLRKSGLRLPTERQLLWTVPELVVQAFGPSGDAVEPSFESLRMKLEPGVTALGSVLSEVDFNKLKGIFWRARAFEVHGQGNGISLLIPDASRLRRLVVTVLLWHLADPASVDLGILTEAIFGPNASSEQEQLIGAALQEVLHQRG
jgi:NYN domain/OST-HTH/LOTUS domain